MEKILVIGSGGHAKVLVDVILSCENYKIIGYTDREANSKFFDLEFLGDDNQLEALIGKTSCSNAALGIGQIKSAELRKLVTAKYMSCGYYFPPIISSYAVVSKYSQILNGAQVFHNAVINPSAVVKEFSIVNTGAIIEHDCNIEPFCHIAPRAVLSGGVTVGEGTLIGVGATIKQGITICNNCLIGAGSVIIKDCKTPGLYFGNPAKKIK